MQKQKLNLKFLLVTFLLGWGSMFVFAGYANAKLQSSVIAIAGIDYDGDGVEELAVMQNDNGDHNFDFYDIKTSKTRLVGKDPWNIPSKDSTLGMIGIDINRDGKDEIGVVKRVGGKYHLYIYTPRAGKKQGVFIKKLNIGVPLDPDVVDLAAIDYNGDGKDEIGVIRDEKGDYNFYLYDSLSSGKLIGKDPWSIPAGNNLVGIAGIDRNKDKKDEVAVFRVGEDKLSRYSVSKGTERNKLIAHIPAKVSQAVSQVTKTARITRGKYIDIDIKGQKLEIYREGIIRGRFPISTGKWEMPTPLGWHKIRNKVPRAYSKEYDLYMPWWMAFTLEGHGIHELPEWKDGTKEGAGHLGYRVSHGCVRLGIGPAKFVYDWAEIGIPVYVH